MEFASIVTFGWFITNMNQADIDMDEARINRYNANLINFESIKFASKSVNFLPLSKWAIYCKGRVLRWSKLHYELENKYKELKNK